MEFINKLEIKNFKSLSHIKMDCKRINLFVGRPNVGKSNILEALCLFSGSYGNLKKEHFLNEFIRYTRFSDLFYDQNISNPVTVETNIGDAILKYHKKSNGFSLTTVSDQDLSFKVRLGDLDCDQIKNYLITNNGQNNTIANSYFKVNNKGLVNDSHRNKENENPIKKYTFKDIGSLSEYPFPFLSPPYGENLISVLRTDKDLRKTVAGYFKEYDLELLLDVQENKLEILKRVDGLIYKLPYNLIADTLQRIIFYTAAIKSNRDSILLLEEPESHSFPPYVRALAEDIYESKDNQFFIATHSPYLFNTLISKAGNDEVAVFITDFIDHKTTVRQLSEEEIKMLLDDGIDVFFNTNIFK